MVKTAPDLMAELAQAINDYLRDAPQIREKIAEIKTAGFDVLITFEANVVLLPDDDMPARGASKSDRKDLVN